MILLLSPPLLCFMWMMLVPKEPLTVETKGLLVVFALLLPTFNFILLACFIGSLKLHLLSGITPRDLSALSPQEMETLILSLKNSTLNPDEKDHENGCEKHSTTVGTRQDLLLSGEKISPPLTTTMPASTESYGSNFRPSGKSNVTVGAYAGSEYKRVTLADVSDYIRSQR